MNYPHMRSNDGSSPPPDQLLARAYRLVAGDLEPRSDVAFAGTPDQPDVVRKRVLLQSTWWVDIHATWHRLEEMTRDYRANVLSHIEGESATWMTQAVAWTVIEALNGWIEPLEARDRLELLDLLTPGWSHHTPLGRRLHDLNATTPDPLVPPQTLLGAVDSNTPETLREEDGGTWRITTASTSAYLVDLDRRRILRQPGDSRTQTRIEDGEQQHRPVPVNALDHDWQWTGLTGLLLCRTGQSLIALDQRPWGTSYRISTEITEIRRTPDAGQGAGQGAPRRAAP